jgi:hypothetical protein
VSILFCIFRTFPLPLRAAAGGVALVSVVWALTALKLEIVERPPPSGNNDEA